MGYYRPHVHSIGQFDHDSPVQSCRDPFTERQTSKRLIAIYHLKASLCPCGNLTPTVRSSRCQLCMQLTDRARCSWRVLFLIHGWFTWKRGQSTAPSLYRPKLCLSAKHRHAEESHSTRQKCLVARPQTRAFVLDQIVTLWQYNHKMCETRSA